VEAMVDTQAPSNPTNLTAMVAATTISLSWTASTDNVGVTGYLIERCQGTGCSNFVQVATSSTNSYVDSNLMAEATYDYRVRATDAAGNLSGYSNTLSSITQDCD
jgi:chitodextrinase